MSTLQLIPASGNPIDLRADQTKVVLGRSVASDIVLDDASISRRHLSIERRGAVFHVTDLGSANGSFLDGVRFEETELRDGAELRLGSCKLKVRIVAEEGDSEATIMVDIDEVTAEMPPVAPVRKPGASEDATASMPVAPAHIEDLVSSSPPAAVPPPAAKKAPDDPIDETMMDTEDDAPAVSPPPPPPPPPRAAAPEPPPPAGGARIAAPSGGPVGQISAPPPDKKGRHPAFWVGIGCGGCLLSVVVVVSMVFGVLYYLSRGATQGVNQHLEALRDAARAVGNYRLTDATLYVTVEPCLMCAGALVHARIGRLVYGAPEPKAGAVVSTQRALDASSLNHRVEVVGGVLEPECRQLMQAFFARRRAG